MLSSPSKMTRQNKKDLSSFSRRNTKEGYVQQIPIVLTGCRNQLVLKRGWTLRLQLRPLRKGKLTRRSDELLNGLSTFLQEGCNLLLVEQRYVYTIFIVVILCSYIC